MEKGCLLDNGTPAMEQLKQDISELMQRVWTEGRDVVVAVFLSLDGKEGAVTVPTRSQYGAISKQSLNRLNGHALIDQNGSGSMDLSGQTLLPRREEAVEDDGAIRPRAFGPCEAEIMRVASHDWQYAGDLAVACGKEDTNKFRATLKNLADRNFLEAGQRGYRIPKGIDVELYLN